MKSDKLQESLMRALQGKLVEDKPLDNQVSIEDIAEGRNVVYQTNFNLEFPVNDIDDARNYLTEDDMVQYLDKDDFNFKDEIISIDWDLENEQSGVIRVTAKRELTQEELDKLSNWISGQNSDGLGEGFEQQDFAESYFNPETGDGPYTYSEAEREIEQLYDRITPEDLINDGYLDQEIWEAVETYRDDNEEETEDMDDDEIYDIIVADIEDYIDSSVIEDAKYEYTNGLSEYNVDDWFCMSSFDWKNNDYKLKQVL